MTLNDELKAAKRIYESIKDLQDEDLLEDMIEAETGLLEIIDALLFSNALDAGCLNGLDIAIDKLAARKKAIQNRIETRRNLVIQAMDISGLKTLKRPCGTVTYKTGKPIAIITDESALPSRFFDPQPNKLNKRSLNEALNNGENIDGAHLSNGAPVLQIRI